ncbi:hypothetical protein Ae201684_013203 [Aphanomyces euteiches]|uniref:HNH nuclease domain-containing protein n=1 Tax=Aphanomyces euteiches TaxID=100861 RepID=A0A6G0WP06_9STRA|nr:hypothetical protein Ae201684_013203 [Aphanomyces euteiches]
MSDRSPNFKANLCLYYDCHRRKKTWIRCILLDISFPASLVTAAHLFRRSNEYLAFPMMQISDIDDERNGLLLSKPLKVAFDHFQISFIYNHSNDCFYLKLFDQSIRNTRLVDAMRNAKQKQVLMNAVSRAKRPCKFDMKTTFGHLDGKALKFRSPGRPFKRCLNLQARLAYAKALKKQDIDPSYNFDDFWSEGFSLDKMTLFRQSIANSGFLLRMHCLFSCWTFDSALKKRKECVESKFKTSYRAREGDISMLITLIMVDCWMEERWASIRQYLA